MTKKIAYYGKVTLIFCLVLFLSEPICCHALSPTQSLSLESSMAFLRTRMDEFHNRFPIYDDVSSAGNHFPVFGALNRPTNIDTPNGSWNDNPHSGATCIRFSFTPQNSSDWGGYYMMNGVLPSGATSPLLNWGTYQNAGINLANSVKSLTFYARGQSGGEKVEFIFGGLGRDPNQNGDPPNQPYPDSVTKQAITVTLTSQWKQYSIDLTNVDTSYILGGFGWDASANQNPAGAVFFVDDINLELNSTGLQNRLAQPRFLRSYLAAPIQTSSSDPKYGIDLVMRNSAMSYDNALALIAFLDQGSADSVRRAQLIGDSFVYAANNDRYYTDGRMRSDYSAGDISLPPGWTPNNRIGTVPIPGFYDETAQAFHEVEQDVIDTGNNAWVMVALLKLYQKTGNPIYLTAARNIGNFIHSMRNDSSSANYQGFLSGIQNPESSSPANRTYASVEHNLDIIAAFTVMNSLTGETLWLNDVNHAKIFVESMLDGSRGCYLAGTVSPTQKNTSLWQLPLDVQVWSILSLRTDIATRYATLLDCAETNHKITADGFAGYDFNNDKDGVWFEGTGQVAVAYGFTGNANTAETINGVLREAQALTVYGDSTGVQAASHDGVSTGFNSSSQPVDTCIVDPTTCSFKYYGRKHIAATAWNVFAQSGFNPYYDIISIDPSLGIDIKGSSLSISLTTTGNLGNNADWWLLAYSPWGHWYSYVYPNQWQDIGINLTKIKPAYQGSLVDLSSLSLFDATGIPSGTYYLYFGVDTIMNGVLDYNSLYYTTSTLIAP